MYNKMHDFNLKKNSFFEIGNSINKEVKWNNLTESIILFGLYWLLKFERASFSLSN
jgi:hypothetical protein